MVSTTIRRCTIPGCHTEISQRSRLSECPACRAYLVAYLKARPAKVLERRQKIHLYDSRLQVIMPGDPEELDNNSKLVAPANYKPQSKRGKAVAKQTPPTRRAHQPTNNRTAASA